MNPALIGAVSAVAGAIIGASVSMLLAFMNHKRESKKHNETLFMSSLSLLAGDENQRSAGLSIIEGRFAKDQEYINILLPALSSMGIFLLLHTQNTESRVEFFNWLRVMTILEYIFRDYNPAGGYRGEVGNSLYLKAADLKYNNGAGGGIEMTMGTLRQWAKQYGSDDIEQEI